MNPTNNRPESSIEETASLWAARLEGASLTSSQRTELDSWLAGDPRHREALANYCQLSTDLERHLPSLLSSGAITRPDLPPARDPRPARRSAAWGWLTAAAMATAVVATVMLQHSGPSDTPASYATPVAQRQSITLDDGTQVDLNAGTHLVVEHTATERRVRLADGQAFFLVTKDPSRPFIVETPAGSVRVTGTAFDVRNISSDALEVTVEEGSVQVRLGPNAAPESTGPVALTAHDQLTTRSGEAPLVRNIGAEGVTDMLAWRSGQIVFYETPLDQVLPRFAHYHGRGISADPGAGQLALSGRYSLENLDSFFANLESVLAVKVVRDQSGTTRVELRD